jgi:molybdopterin-guanine dinucleotide biosynthesis protein A
MSAAPKIAGLLLAGGQSQRFGAEKAMAELRGRPMIEIVAERFADFQGVAVSAPAQSGAAAFARARGYSLIEDDPASPAGPLAGICAGLEWAAAGGFSHLATAPCDTPLLPQNLYTTLAAELSEASAAFVATGEGDHALCALWRIGLLAPLRETLAAGNHPAIRNFLLANGARRLTFADAAAFANANTPEELARLAAKRNG